MPKNTRYALLIIVAVLIIGSIFYLEKSSGKNISRNTGEAVEVQLREENSAPASNAASPTSTSDVATSVPASTNPDQAGTSSNQTQINPVPTVNNNQPVQNSNPSPALLSQAQKSTIYQKAKEITTPDGFINTDGKNISISDYIGKKVILVDFWTYSCINCQRTTPFLNAWYEKYEDQGLVIIGVHTPEFDFEKDYNNVKAAVEKFGIKFPVVLDNDFSTWSAYKNNYWPRKYLIDIDGFIVYDHIGEGAYEFTEKKIQEALAERAAILKADVSVSKDTVDIPSVAFSEKSPEVYFGSERNEFLSNGSAHKAGVQTFTLPESFSKNKLYLSGKWNITGEYAETLESGNKVVFPYFAKKVFMVADGQGSIEVRRDGELVGEVKIDGPQLYTLTSENSASEHTLELTSSTKNLKLFTFTFE
jgi:thiol-disulfide isomerase/thioredoxin